jgi:F-type H+-transporting ATPase subunit gamma
MQRLSDLQARLHGLGELADVVGALRSVSAARVQQTHGVLDAIREYTAIVQDALGEAARGLLLPPHGSDAQGDHGFVVAFGSEHGFVGALNERVLEHAVRECQPSDDLLVVGSRAGLAADERRHRVSWRCAMASQVGAIDGVALRVAEQLATHPDLGRVVLVYTRRSGGTSRIVTETLLPFDLRSFVPRSMNGPTALSNLPRRTLLDGLVQELLFAQLAHAATESFASENTARLAAMESAADNVAGKIDEIGKVERELRQEEITTELMDVVTGAEAIVEAR